MSAVTSARYAAAARESFRTLLFGWVGSLPVDGWAGTVGELFTALDAHDRTGRASLPSGAGLTRSVKDQGSNLAALGWEVKFTRTKAARTIRFRRAG